MSSDNFVDWVAPETVSKENTLKELRDGITALGAVETAEKEAQHLMVGAEIKKAVGAKDTVDVYGGGPEEHGSPYKIEGGDKTALVGKFLRSKGYRPIGKNKWKRGVVLVELGYGKDKNETYIYVTDDNQE